MTKAAAPAARTTSGRGRVYASILDTIGDTPCVRINRLAPEGVDLYVKVEVVQSGRLGEGPPRHQHHRGGGARRQAEARPDGHRGDAGNTGIGLAMVCAAKGYPLVVTMVETFSIERRKLMRFLGAKVVLTPKAEKGFGMYQKAVELAEANGWFLAHQFETEANALDPRQHHGARDRGRLRRQRLDYWVTGYGTGGTVSGVGARAEEGAARR